MTNWERSMMGSGIYSEDYTGVFHCDECEADYELDGTTDDWKHTAYATCEKCGADLEVEINNEPDPDAMYEAWKESQLDND